MTFSLLVAGLTLTVSQPASASPTTFYVSMGGSDGPTCGTSGSPCLTIQQALANANDGDTISVGVGTYVGTDIAISKAVTVSGVTGAVITVPDSAQVNGFDITANNVGISGFVINGPVSSPYTSYAWGSNNSRGIDVASGVTGFSITNNTIENVRNAILIDGRNSTGSLTNNVLENTKSAISVQYTDGDGIAMTGNTGGVGNAWGVNLHLNGYWDGTNVHSNPYPGGAAPTGVQQALLANSSANGGWTVQDQAYTASNRTQVHVATTGSSGAQGDLLSPISTIQGGVDAVVSSGVVNVAAGTYNEQVVIDKALTLRGAQYGVAGDLHNGAESIVDSLDVTNANVTIDGFEVDPGSNNDGVGLSFSGGTSEAVQNNIITGYGYNSAANHGTEGVVFDGTSGMLFQHNLLKSPTPTNQAQFSNAAAQDGIFAGSGISDNTQILNNVFSGASTYPGTDIGLSYSSGANPVISGNVSTGGATLVTLFNSTGGQITGNTFTGDPDETGSIIYIGGGDTNTTISDNNVSGGYFGVALRNVYGDGPNGTTTVTANTLLDNYGGGVSLSGASIDSNSTVVIHTNDLGSYSFTSNDTTCGDDVATCGLSNSTSYVVDATNNYWGSDSGPYNASTNPGGAGSPVTALATFSPWWTTATGGPTAPTAISATAGNASATVRWTAPALTGTNESTIASYTVAASGSGGQTCTTTGATTCTVSDLTNDDSYSFSVTATNSDASMGASAVSNPVSPARPPVAPTTAPPVAPTTTPPVAPPTGPAYAPPPAGVPSSSLGVPTSVTATSTAPATVSQSSNGASETVTVPPGALPSGTTVSVYAVTDTAPLVAQVPSDQTYVVSLAVAWQAPDGTSPTATAPITMSITDPGIVAGDVVYEVTAAGLVAVGTADADGSVTITFSVDPIFIVAAPTQVAQAPLVVTSLSGTPGTAVSITTSGGSGTGALTYTVTNGTARGCQVNSSGLLTASSTGTCVVIVTKASDESHEAVSSAPTSITMAPTVTPAYTSTLNVKLDFPFAYYSSILSPTEAKALTALSKKLTPGTLVTFTGYADLDTALALRRATAVSHFLSKLVRIHVVIRTVTDLGVRLTTVTCKELVQDVTTAK